MSKWLSSLDHDLQWRKGELAALKLKLFEERPQRPADTQTAAFKALLRAAWAMLYAHYEGYCLFSLSLYLDTIEQLKVPRGDCRDDLQVFSMQHHLPIVRNKSEKDFFTFLIQDHRAMFSAVVDFPRDKKLKGEFDLRGRSNLWPALLDECCGRLNIRCDSLLPKDTRLRLLVARRNDIAHGKDAPVRDFAEYDEFDRHVIAVMEGLADSVGKALDTCLYLKPAIKRRETERLAYRIWLDRGGDPDSNWLEAERCLAEGQRF